MADLGQVAYMAYFEMSGGMSLAGGGALPMWQMVDPRIKEAWRVAAAAVMIEAEREAAEEAAQTGQDR